MHLSPSSRVGACSTQPFRAISLSDRLALTRILVALPAADADLAGLVERGYLRERPAPVRATFDGKAVRGRGPAPAYLVNPLAAAAPRSGPAEL